MNKAFKYIGGILLVFTFVFLLVGCSGSKFYNTFKALGAEIEKDNCFTEITVDEFKTKKEAKESFVVILVSSDGTSSVSVVSAIQYEATNQNRDTKVLVFDVKEGILHATKGEEYRQAFGVKEISSSLGFVAIGIKNGNLLFDTSNPNDFCDNFKTTSTDVNIHAVAQYILEDKISK